MAFPNYDGSSRFGQRVAAAVGGLRGAYDELKRTFNSADAIAYSGGGSPDFSLLEKNTEDPTAAGNDLGVNAGGGENFRNNLNGVCLHLEDAGFLAMVNKLDKGF